ncbi:MAG: nucleotidyltransferase domain-containing protein [Candidatus Thorarchaeota archaeon]|nr:MAG: nucleotidyltransferase domain-containing protein [Candidatus Thorarchaeota archaeon]
MAEGRMLMRSNQTSKSQGTHVVEWSLQRAQKLGLPQTYLSMLDEILTGISSHCNSVVLFGSWAEGISTSHSDLDLLFISKDENEKNIIMTVLERMLPETRNSVYDCKVLLIDDLQRLLKGPQHFAIWTMLTNGVVLHGSDLRDLVKFNHERVSALINEILERISAIITSLESNIQFTGACVQLAYITRTLYFLDKYLLNNGQHHQCKQEFIEQHLGSLYSSIERLYREVVLSKKSLGKLEVIQQVQTRNDFGYSQKQYQELYVTCVILERIIHDLKSQIQFKLVLP